MRRINLIGTALFVLFGGFTVIQYLNSFLHQVLIFNLDNVLLMAGWPLFCGGAIIYLWARQRWMGNIVLALFSSKIVITIYLALVEGKDLLSLKSFWIDLAALILGIGVLIVYPIGGRQKGQ